MRISKGQTEAPNLACLLPDTSMLKRLHFAQFGLAMMYNAFSVLDAPFYFTKIALRLVRAFTNRYDLKVMLQELIDVDISHQQTAESDAPTQTEAQKAYHASDVLHLRRLKVALDGMLAREGRSHVALARFDFRPARARLDLMGWPDLNTFSH